MKKIPRWSILIVIFLLAIVLCVITSKLLTINSIQVRGGSLIGIDELSGRPLFLLNDAEMAKNLLRKNPTVESITFEKKYPNELFVTVQKSKQVGMLVVAKGYYILSSSGKVISKERTRIRKLPVITIGQQFPFESYAVGEKMTNQEIVTGAYLLGKFAENGIEIETVEIRGFDVVVCKGAGHTYLFSASKNQAEQFSDFLIVYRQFFVENKKYSSIDVRFEKPVVVFER